MIEILVKMLIGANLFFAGYYLAENYKWQDTATSKFLCVLWCLGTMVFGCAYIVSLFLIVLISEGFKKIDAIFQISFWFVFYLTKKFDNLEKNKLEMINRTTINVRNKKTMKDRIYRYCTLLINKRNNFVYAEPSEPQF